MAGARLPFCTLPWGPPIPQAPVLQSPWVRRATTSVQTLVFLYPRPPHASGGPARAPRYSRLLEAPHAVQNVELLPPFGKIHLPVNIVWVAQVNKGEVLQDKPPGRTERPGHCSGEHVWPVLVSSCVNS